MISIKEQIEYIKNIRNNSTIFDNSPDMLLYQEQLNENIDSIIHSLESISQFTNCNLDCFVAVMHKDTYAKFIEYCESIKS